MPSNATPPTPACRRTSDGTFNDLAYPAMGAAGTPFARNAAPPTVRLAGADAGNLASSPSPRDVSNRLLARQGRFEAATSINMLAAAWVQFMGHDWFNHQVAKPDSPDQLEIPLAEDDLWRRRHGRMLVPRTLPDPARPACSSLTPTFANTATHWWDGSQLYGSSREEQAAVRGCPYAAGKLKMNDRIPGRLPRDAESGAEIAGFRENWWLGLSLMHTLFALEHNA